MQEEWRLAVANRRATLDPDGPRTRPMSDPTTTDPAEPSAEVLPHWLRLANLPFSSKLISALLAASTTIPPPSSPPLTVSWTASPSSRPGILPHCASRSSWRPSGSSPGSSAMECGCCCLSIPNIHRLCAPSSIRCRSSSYAARWRARMETVSALWARGMQRLMAAGWPSGSRENLRDRA